VLASAWKLSSAKKQPIIYLSNLNKTFCLFILSFVIHSSVSIGQTDTKLYWGERWTFRVKNKIQKLYQFSSINNSYQFSVSIRFEIDTKFMNFPFSVLLFFCRSVDWSNILRRICSEAFVSMEKFVLLEINWKIWTISNST
jgi:hypothetical protein